MKKFLYPVLVVLIIVGSFLAGSWYSKRESVRVESSGVKSSAVKTDVKPHTVTDTDTSSMAPGTVQITPERQQTIGVWVGVVEKKPVVHTLRLLGRVAADEVRVYRIVASVDGWIREAYDNSVGTLVKKDQVLATFYSPAFLDVQQTYLYALDRVARLRPGKSQELDRIKSPAQITLDELTLQRQIDLLRGMGMLDAQIDEIARTRNFTQDVRITAPADGFVIARNVSPEQRFLKGAELYQIADLSRVWILADVFEHEVQYFKPGVKAKVSVPYQKKTYQATVTEVLPIFDATTRTLKVRLETDNPGFVLRPDMFVDLELPIKLPPAITVPADAILYSGLRKTVFIDRGNGFFEPRKVETGWRLGNRVEIVRGLMQGEKIVLSGNFFIDSESRLQAAGQGIYGAMNIDPVCGMEVDEARAKATGKTSVYHGKTYYFCAVECKEQFDKNPGSYIKQ